MAIELEEGWFIMMFIFRMGTNGSQSTSDTNESWKLKTSGTNVDVKLWTWLGKSTWDKSAPTFFNGWSTPQLTSGGHFTKGVKPRFTIAKLTHITRSKIEFVVNSFLWGFILENNKYHWGGSPCLVLQLVTQLWMTWPFLLMNRDYLPIKADDFP